MYDGENKMKNKMKYLISMRNYNDALIVSDENKLRPFQFEYIPWYPEKIRKEKLSGIHGYEDEYLIGDFSDFERRELKKKL